MGTDAPLIIESSNLSEAWGATFLRLMDPGTKSLGPTLISVGDFEGDLPQENHIIRDSLETTLKANNLPSCDATAMTIFPYKIWIRRNRPICKEFSTLCVDRLLPRMKKRNPLNNKGTYFERMMVTFP